MSTPENKKLMEFLELVGKLKHEKRTGWVIKDLNDCETISGHMYRMAMMTFLLNEGSGINRTRCMEIALVHDLAESIVGDITPYCGVSKEDKQQREDEAMKYIASLIGSSGEQVYTLFREYEDNLTPEAKFVKDLDKFDAVLQAFEYEKKYNTPCKFQDFFDRTQGNFSHPIVLNLLSEVYSQRKKFIDEHKLNSAKKSEEQENK